MTSATFSYIAPMLGWVALRPRSITLVSPFTFDQVAPSKLVDGLGDMVELMLHAPIVDQAVFQHNKEPHRQIG